jgi:hypothetical protein
VRLETVDLSLARPQIHFLNLDELCALDKFVAEEEGREDGNVDVGRDKGLCAEVAGEEAVEAVEDGDGDAEDEAEVSEERLHHVRRSIRSMRKIGLDPA